MRGARLAVLVAALGYFVDIYDLLIFGIVRSDSLKDIGIAPGAQLQPTQWILNSQMIALLLGGILWGTLGDKRGRTSVLFGSIILYSIANIANGFVHTVPQYIAARFLAGLGLAGELGGGITLVSESLDEKLRGYGTTIVSSFGIFGAVAGVLVAKSTAWRTAYFIGGGLGFALLLLRVGVLESGVFEKVKADASIQRGNFFALFTSRSRVQRYFTVILVGVPIWYAVGILITTAPEMGAAMGMSPAPKAAIAILFNYAALAIGGFASGVLSQRLRSRKRALLVFLMITAASLPIYFLLGRQSLFWFYAASVVLGFGTGYWSVFVTVAAEQFGTNVRATAATTAPNFVRGSLVPVTLAFNALKGPLGVVGSAAVVGAATLVMALLALGGLTETYGKSLDFVE
jgi:MFS family permease